MKAIFTPSKELADKLIDLRGWPRASCHINPTIWHMNDATPDFYEVHVVNGGPAEYNAVEALKHWREQGFPETEQSVREHKKKSRR